MGLARTKDRRTIIVTNLSFADGQVTLINYNDAPLRIQEHVRNCRDGILDYYEFCWDIDLLDDNEFGFIAQLSPAEHGELFTKVCALSGLDTSEFPEAKGGDIEPRILSEEDEAEISKFIEAMNKQPNAVDPFDSPESDDDQDDEGDDGLASV